MEKNISMAVIKRLPKYHRYLQELLEKNILKISSKELSDMIGFSASQIRQDFNHFGGFGQQGYGYNVAALLLEIGKILGLNNTHNTVIIGAGNMGQALANSPSFEKFNFNLIALFDVKSDLVGKEVHGTVVHNFADFKKFAKKNKIDIAFICTNNSSAQDTAKVIVDCGIKAIWNFALVDLNVPNDVVVENVHLIDHLFTLSYFLTEKK